MEMYFHFVSDFRVLRSSTNSVLKVRHAVNKAWCRCLYKKMSLVHRFVACLLACFFEIVYAFPVRVRHMSVTAHAGLEGSVFTAEFGSLCKILITRNEHAVAMSRW